MQNPVAPMSPSRWSHSFMDGMRTKMDPLADAVIERLFTEARVDSINGLMRTLVENDEQPSSRLPRYVKEYLAQTQADVPKLDREKLRQGQKFFELFGPEAMLVLGFYSLPASYAARRGVQVLYRTGYLHKHAVRRVFETAQMVVDVMAEGGLEPDGRGVRTVQKVRLMHAAVRYTLLHDAKSPWDAQDLGQPINQEDMAGTLMTFSFVVLEGLKMLGVEPTAELQESWLYTWAAVGRMMGVDPELVPASVEEARELTFLIRKRQIAASPEGVAMTASLIEGVRQIIPGLLEGLPESMIRFFLDQDQWQGLNVADMLGVPQPGWAFVIPQALRRLTGLVERMGDASAVAARLLRFLSMNLLEGLLLLESKGHRTSFSIPKSLLERWRHQQSVLIAARMRAPSSPFDSHVRGF
ncbi:oxygenase MpaB family protein [Hyalangium versicolor]|uniref:oxygenase MpaB family protein n=1 Tax=Hyalangium versicolor TaxID=2861190 RepID=UPI001CCCFCB8|nr:oxygenase MpaB family protein [Hyalangium versicolor]